MGRRVIRPAEQAKIARGFIRYEGSLRSWARKNGISHSTVISYIKKLEEGHYRGVGEFQPEST